MRATVISGSLFTEMVKGGAGYLGSKKSVVNDLNVFPIPDGDTGDNMYMTIDSGVSSTAKTAALESARLDEVSKEIARGMLLGARGNSGVILSRIFSGISKGFAGVEKADVQALAYALEQGVKEAYGAVAEPVEGTILTVFREAVAYANGRIGKRSTLQSYFEDFTRELRASLGRTPELLAVLKEAGVVDSGGAGLVYIAEGMKSALRGESVLDFMHAPASAKKTVNTALFNENSVLKFGYCTEFLLQLQTSKVDVKNFDLQAFIDWLNKNGESVVCFAEGSVIKVHVHTMHPGQILEHCQNYGEFLTLKIENMTLQNGESKIENRFDLPLPKKRKKYGTVTVAMGQGLKDTFVSLGVDYVVDGGQSMNPSAADFIKAFDEVGADTVFVFPNNGNVILTARQAADLYDRSTVLVVNTKNIGQGYAALSMLDTSSDDSDAILDELNGVISEVVTGGVSTAVRSTEMDGIQVVAGDYIGFVDDKVYADEKIPEDAVKVLCEKLDAGAHDVMLLICGEGAKEENARALYDELKNAYRRTEIIMIDGGQPIYNYIAVFE